MEYLGYLVDTVSDGKHVQSLLPLLPTIFLHQSDDNGAEIVIIVIIRVGHGHAVLRICPECVCNTEALWNDFSQFYYLV